MPAVAPPAHAIEGKWTLPPLILHPFGADESADQLLEGSRASLVLNGLLPNQGQDRHDLETVLLRARLQELRMLYFLGKDVLRWIEQCLDFVQRSEALRAKGIRAQSFAGFLVETPPAQITRKLQVWGVNDQRSVFSRALALTATIGEPPTAQTLSPLFLHHYHRFLDYFYVCFQNLETFTELRPQDFDVELFASAEYSQMLADQWQA